MAHMGAVPAPRGVMASRRWLLKKAWHSLHARKEARLSWQLRTIQDVAAGVAVHAPHIALAHVSPDDQSMAPADCPVGTGSLCAAAFRPTLQVVGQARAVSLERLCLEPAGPVCSSTRPLKFVL